MPAVARFVFRKKLRDFARRNGPVLEPSLREDRHLQPEYRPHATGNDLTLEGVESFMRAFSESGEWDRFGDRDDGRAQVRTETLESECARAGVATHAGPAVSAGVREGVLDGIHAPALLVQHAIVHHAPDGELAVGLDWIILEILIAAITVNQQPPRGISLPNTGEESEVHRS